MTDCNHEVEKLSWGSGGYYIFCQQCAGSWVFRKLSDEPDRETTPRLLAGPIAAALTRERDELLKERAGWKGCATKAINDAEDICLRAEAAERERDELRQRIEHSQEQFT